jgi:hypothetical protein
MSDWEDIRLPCMRILCMLTHLHAYCVRLACLTSMSFLLTLGSGGEPLHVLMHPLRVDAST